MQSLEERIAMLEGMLQTVNPDVATDHFGISDNGNGVGFSMDLGRDINNSDPILTSGGNMRGNSNEHVSNTLPPGLSESTTAVNTDADTVDDLSSEVGLLCLNAAGKEPHYFGPSSSFSFSRILGTGLGRFSIPGHRITMDKPYDQFPQIHSASHPEPLPTRQLGTMLSQAYFANIHPQYPFLHRPTFLEWEDAAMTANEMGDSSQLNPGILYFVFMVSYSLLTA